jgi:RNA polymerase sigma-70 factor (ECF subfamily)
MVTETLDDCVPLAAAPAQASSQAEGPARQLSFGEVYDEHVDFVWRSAQRLGVEEAALDDVVQQVFLVVHRRLGEFEGRSSIKTWLFAILLRAVRDHRRTLLRKSPHARCPSADPDTLPEPAVGPEELLEQREAARIIGLLLEELEGDKRTVFVMVELEQMSANEVSEATGLDVRAVYSRLRAARTDFERAASRMRKQMRMGRTR